MSIFTELKRRNVFKVGAAYLVVAWLLLQLLSILLPAFEAPAWVMKVFVALLSVGLVVALFLAWAFELTPEGIKSTKAADATASSRPQTNNNLTVVAFLVMAAALGFLVVDNYLLPDADSAAESAQVAAPTVAEEAPATAVVVQGELDKSLAVMPFDDLSQSGDQEYFADGLSEELMNKLSLVDDLLVTGRTSAFYFKGRDDSHTEIGTQLGVNYILDGSVRRDGDQMRINTQLVTAADGVVLWSGTYDRNVTEIFAVQDEISTAVTTALSVTLRAGEFNIPGMTRNFAVYEEYLKALRSLTEVSSTSIRRAMDQIEAVVSSEPEFAQGWNLLIQIYSFALQLLPADQQQGLTARIEEAGQRYGELLPDSALVKLRPVRAMLDQRQYFEAEQLLLPLLEQNDIGTREYRLLYTSLLATVGRSRDALAQFQLARRLDPKNNAAISRGIAQVYFSLGRTQEGIAEVNRGLADTFIADGLRQALNRIHLYALADPANPEPARELHRQTQSEPAPGSVPALWLAGDIDGALAQARANLADTNQGQVTSGAWMQWATIMGDYELALSVRRATNNRDSMWMPHAAPMRKLPGFKDFVREQGLVDYWRASGNWGDFCRPINDDFECF